MDSFRSVCRVCLQYNQETNSFFDEVEYDVFIKLALVFQKVADIEILETDDKPSRLCQECTERLLSAYDFICAVEKSEGEIENYLNQRNKAEEQLQQLEVEEDVVVEIDAVDIDVQDIEVLDEEFQIEPDQIESNKDVEIVIDEEISIDEISETSNNFLPQIPSNDNKRAEVPVGSRLSKPISSRHYKCSSCQRSFAKMETLERHIKTAHTFVPPEKSNNSSEQSKASYISQDDKSLKCPHCPQAFKRRNNYIRHLVACHSYEAEQLTAEDKELALTKHTYKRSNCPYCGQSFTQASLIVHIRRHTGENPYQCNECEKAFPRRQDLVVHQRQHTGEKPHICSVCTKSFSRANKLGRHMRVHTGERPYKCTECSRCFAQSNDLKIHMRRHTGEKPYKCSVCSEAFICGAALKTHRRQKNHHSPEDDLDDPFANWRVCKRKLKADVINDEPAKKANCFSEATFAESKTISHSLNNAVARRNFVEESDSMEFLEIIQE